MVVAGIGFFEEIVVEEVGIPLALIQTRSFPAILGCLARWCLTRM